MNTRQPGEGCRIHSNCDKNMLCWEGGCSQATTHRDAWNVLWGSSAGGWKTSPNKPCYVSVFNHLTSHQQIHPQLGSRLHSESRQTVVTSQRASDRFCCCRWSVEVVSSDISFWIQKKRSKKTILPWHSHCSVSTWQLLNYNKPSIAINGLGCYKHSACTCVPSVWSWPHGSGLYFISHIYIYINLRNLSIHSDARDTSLTYVLWMQTWILDAVCLSL